MFIIYTGKFSRHKPSVYDRRPFVFKPIVLYVTVGQGEAARASGGPVHGQRQGDEAVGSDRLHQVRLDPNVRVPGKGECG